MLGTQTFSKNSAGVFVFVVVLIIGLFYFPSVFKWWYEDDTFQYFYVSTIQNPVDIFANAETMRKFSRAFVPVQIFSYWIDYKLFGFNPFAAYIHSLLSLLFTSIALFKVTERLTKESLVAMGAVVTWLLLPTTLVVTQFIATRHYVEGLFFALLSVHFLLNFLEKEKDKSFADILLVVLFASLSMLCKEIYATSMLFLLFATGIVYKRGALVFSSLVLAVSYYYYRSWVFGLDVNYTMPFLGIKQYLQFLIFQVYTISSNNFAYLIVVGIFVLNFLLVKREGKSAFKSISLFLGLITACLLALYPVAYAVLLTYKTPGTWYRATFITNTILVLWGVYSLSKIVSKKLFVMILCLSLIPVTVGILKTRKLWDEKMARAEMEGKFYLENPDKLLYSEEDASWFIDGVQKMYPKNSPHFINKQVLVGEQPKTALSNHSTIWRYDSGSFIPDDKFYQDLKKQNGME